MANHSKSPTSETQPATADAAINWLRQFADQAEDRLARSDAQISTEPDAGDAQRRAIQAILSAILQSGPSAESIVSLVGQISNERKSDPIEWNSDLNRRRFELIDKDIQQDLTSAEQVELASLTDKMRRALDTEVNMPMEGAVELHRKLLGL